MIAYICPCGYWGIRDDLDTKLLHINPSVEVCELCDAKGDDVQWQTLNENGEAKASQYLRLKKEAGLDS
jgi:hypothetical protein